MQLGVQTQQFIVGQAQIMAMKESFKLGKSIFKEGKLQPSNSLPRPIHAPQDEQQCTTSVSWICRPSSRGARSPRSRVTSAKPSTMTAASRLRSAAEKTSDPIVTELGAIRFAFDKFDFYVRAGRVVVIANLKNLKELMPEM